MRARGLRIGWVRAGFRRGDTSWARPLGAACELDRAAGIEAFVPKSWNLEEMLSEIQRVLSQGEAVSAPDQVSLTTRQREVLERVERGLSNKEIAIDLGIAPNTVKIHMSALFSLFGAHNRTQLLLRAKSHL